MYLDYDTALTKYQAILDKYSESQDKDFIPLVRSHSLYHKAIILYRKKDNAGAIKTCNELLQQYPQCKELKQTQELISAAERRN